MAVVILADDALPVGRPLAPAPTTLTTLTAREAEVLERLGRGLTIREIAEQLHLAEKTVKHHVTRILQKLHVRSRTEAALFAMRSQLGGAGKGGGDCS